MFYIWSNRHREWWGPNRGGYSSRLEAAGRYTKAEAGDICTSGLPGANVAVDDLLANQFIGNADAIEQTLADLKRI